MKATTKSLWSATVSAASESLVAANKLETAAKAMGEAVVAEIGTKPTQADYDALWNQLITGKKSTPQERKAKSRAMAWAKSSYELVLPEDAAKKSAKGKGAADAGSKKKQEAKKASVDANEALVEAALNQHDEILAAFLVNCVEAYKTGKTSVRVPKNPAAGLNKLAA